MPPGKKGSGKSSASSGTRKKQAAKKAKKSGDAAPAPQGPQRGQKKDKKNKKEPKKKVFVPPPKPPQPPPDPLDTLGLASLLPPDLVVLLRKAAKKDVVTRSRALEGLLAWVDGNGSSGAASGEDGESSASASFLTPEERENALVMMLPSWAHLFPRLAASPTRRLRLLTAQIHARLLSPTLSTRSELTQSHQYIEPILGPWATLAWDTDRATALAARDSWEKSVSWTDDGEGDKLLLSDYLSPLANYLSLLLVQGSSAAIATGAAPPALSRGQSFANGTEGRDAKNRDDTNVEEDPHGIDARLAAGALGVLTWIFSSSASAADSCEELVNLLHSYEMWGCLYASQQRGQGLGIGYPVTRTRGWELLEVLTAKHDALLGQVLEVVAPVALAAAWEERDGSTQRRMLDALLPLLSKHPEAWQMVEARGEAEEDDEDDDEDDDSSSEDEDEDAAEPSAKAAAADSATLSPKLAAFQAWTQSGCSNQPLQGLPTILVFLTTIPAPLFPQAAAPWNQFLASMWAGYESGLYDGSGDRLMRSVFFSSYVECSAYLVGRVSKGSTEEAARLASDHLGKVWTEDILAVSDEQASAAVEGRRVNPAAAARLNNLRQAMDERLANTLGSLAKIDAAAPLLDAMFARVDDIARGAAISSSTHIERGASILASLASNSALTQQVQARIAKAADEAAISCKEDKASKTLDSRVLLLSGFLAKFPADLGPAPATRTFAQDVLSTFIAQQSLSTAALSSFVSAYTRAAPPSDVQSTVVTLVESAASLSDQKAKVQALQCLLDGLPADVRLDAPSGTKLDDVALDVARELAEGSKTEGEAFLTRILDQPGPLVDAETVKQILAILITHLHGFAREGQQQQGSSSSSIDQVAKILLEWVQKAPQERLQQVRDIELLELLLIAAFTIKYLRPRRQDSAGASLWDVVSSDSKAADVALDVLREAVLDSQIEVIVVLEAARRFLSSSRSSDTNALAILPSKEKMDEALLAGCSATSPSPALAILDPLIPSTPGPRSPSAALTHDIEGFSPWARSAYALLLTLEESRSTAKANPWALPHLIFLATICEDELNATGSSGGLIEASRFESTPDVNRLQGILVRAVQVSSGILAAGTGSLPETWHKTATEALQKNVEGAIKGSDGLLSTLASLWQQCLNPSADARLCRVFSRLLTGLLSFTSAGDQEAVLWLRLASATESKSPLLAEAIALSGAKGLALQTPWYDRQRNDVVSRLASTPPSKAATEGVRLLRLAVALAPPAESDIALIPQQRAVFLLQGLQRWMSSDEDFGDDVSWLLADLFLHVAPIVQDMPGSHLDFFYDIVESNLEVAALGEDASLPGLYGTLQLLELLSELAERNKVLKEVHGEHEEAIAELVGPLFASLATLSTSSSTAPGKAQQTRTSLPLELTADLLVSVVRRGQSSKAFQGAEHRGVLCKLLGSSMRSVQATAYRMLAASIRAHVQDLIFQSAMDKGDNEDDSEQPEGAADVAESATAATSASTPAKHRVEITPQLLEAVRQPIAATVEDLAEDADLCRATLSYFLAWLAMFEHFEGATPALRSVFSSQLQSEGLLAGSLLPTVFDLVEPQRSGRSAAAAASSSSTAAASSSLAQAYDPDRFSLDELFLDSLSPTYVPSLRHLAAHIYLRSLLHVAPYVREWWSGIKDRQLSLGVAAFTTRHCSPLLTARELAHLRDPESEARQQLMEDDSMSVKVLSSGAGAGGGEVVATYVVDEHPMELAIRLPPSYPLQPIEVRDVRRIGVAESTWRAWLLAVQRHVTSSEGGRVADALLLFKRNAEAKFSGYEGAECAICYSIISPEDKKSLPNKHCKTCKHGFHAACLFRWVSTSGSATCPLCRSTL